MSFRRSIPTIRRSLSGRDAAGEEPLIKPRRTKSSPLNLDINEEDEFNDASSKRFHEWSVRFSLRLQMCAQMAFEVGSAGQYTSMHRILIVADDTPDCGVQISSFDVFTAAELVSELGESAAIVERNFSAKLSMQKNQSHVLVPVYTIFEGQLRIVPKFATMPSGSSPHFECNHDDLKIRLQAIVDEINRDNARFHNRINSPGSQSANCDGEDGTSEPVDSRDNSFESMPSTTQIAATVLALWVVLIVIF